MSNPTESSKNQFGMSFDWTKSSLKKNKKGIKKLSLKIVLLPEADLEG